MNERDYRTETDLSSGAARCGAAADDQEPMQPPTLSPEEAKRIEDYEALEDFIEETPEGDLSIISDQDVPGAPG